MIDRGFPRYYVFDCDNQPVGVDLETWARWFGTVDRRVAFTAVAPGVDVPTVFLGLDHNVFGDRSPVLWETMVFDDYGGGDMDRYTSYAEAIEGHNRMVAQMREKLAQREVKDGA